MSPPGPHAAVDVPRRRGALAIASHDATMGLVILALITLHAFVDKTAATRIEMLYLCHLSSFVLALGLLGRSARAVGAGTLALAALGTPSWIIYAAITHDVGASSVAVHLAPLVIGAHAVFTRGLARGSEFVAIGLFGAALAIGGLVSTPRANLNLAFGPGPGMEWLVVTPPLWRVLLAAVATTLLLGAARLVRRSSR